MDCYRTDRGFFFILCKNQNKRVQIWSINFSFDVVERLLQSPGVCVMILLTALVAFHLALLLLLGLFEVCVRLCLISFWNLLYITTIKDKPQRLFHLNTHMSSCSSLCVLCSLTTNASVSAEVTHIKAWSLIWCVPPMFALTKISFMSLWGVITFISGDFPSDCVVGILHSEDQVGMKRHPLPGFKCLSSCLHISPCSSGLHFYRPVKELIVHLFWVRTPSHTNPKTLNFITDRLSCHVVAAETKY